MKTLISLAIGSMAAISLFFSGPAAAVPGLADSASSERVRVCIAQIADHANYDNAGRVLHEVDSNIRPVSGYTMKINTVVFDAAGIEVVREYRTTCAVSHSMETKLFRIRETALRH